ncbi:MAG: 2-C-methyl-D-erythritol 4-phosphate cytidylyltransferase [Acidobacteria bacterium]|nr:2-C-methyl-D-erythritol 4-phosphate cytidylyltransferase [Acidobacteriota bacterium]
MNTAIIVAAGSGNRFGGETPKQFIEVAGKPLLIHTLARFEECAAIDAVVLVLSAERVSDFAGIAKQFALTKLKAIVAGGATRPNPFATDCGRLAMTVTSSRFTMAHVRW